MNKRIARRTADLAGLDLFFEDKVCLKKYYPWWESLGWEIGSMEMRALFIAINEVAYKNDRLVNLVEIGALVGTSAACFALHKDIDNVITVDDWICSDDQPDKIKEIYKNHDVVSVFSNNKSSITAYRGMSANAETVFNRIAARPFDTPYKFDVVFLDGSNTRSGKWKELSQAVNSLQKHRDEGDLVLFCGTGATECFGGIEGLDDDFESIGNIWFYANIVEGFSSPKEHDECPDKFLNAKNVPLRWRPYKIGLPDICSSMGISNG